MRVQILLLILSGLIVVSCKSDTIPPVAAENIQGHWEVIDAYRNKRQTKLLNRAYMIITDSTFNTNIPPNEGEINYSYNANQLRLNDDENTSYKITSFSNDTMSIATEIKGFDFELTLARKNDVDEN